MRVLVVGSGGREHALAWKIAQSPKLEELHAAPGNPGIAELGNCHPVRAEDGDGVLALARALRVDLVVVGPEPPLVAGLADRLRRGGVPVFGPSAAGARIEGSKAFAKDVLERAGVPTARALPVARPPCVVKADGLATGKGVFVCHNDDELQAALAEVQTLGTRFHIEELLEGEELSVFAVCDGRRAVPLAAARDFKRASDGDAGPNTGGMGAFSPVPGAPLIDRLVADIHRPVLAELAGRDAPFSGLLYAGLMLTADGPRVLEFNCRFGDPEAQAVLPLITSDLLPVLAEAAAGDLGSSPIELSDDTAVTVVIAAKDYPASGDTGSPITGIEEATKVGALVFHAATAERDHTLMTSGGRILGVTGVGRDLATARELTYAAVECISFPGARYRRDIGG
ncbi:MAG: phosphoribosylamine--glycine ligase [Gaiellaceae bacterium]